MSSLMETTEPEWLIGGWRASVQLVLVSLLGWRWLGRCIGWLLRCLLGFVELRRVMFIGLENEGLKKSVLREDGGDLCFVFVFFSLFVFFCFCFCFFLVTE